MAVNIASRVMLHLESFPPGASWSIEPLVSTTSCRTAGTASVLAVCPTQPLLGSWAFSPKSGPSISSSPKMGPIGPRSTRSSSFFESSEEHAASWLSQTPQHNDTTTERAIADCLCINPCETCAGR
jgi:hypothetical protein